MMIDRVNFLYPKSRYHGSLTPENLDFNANLQDFSQRVSIICNLETGGKISAEDAYYQIYQLWHHLEQHRPQSV